jgi:SP family myo-inositol transporter-like MFS transporter 13
LSERASGDILLNQMKPINAAANASTALLNPRRRDGWEDSSRTDHSTSKPFLYSLTALACIGGFLFGYDTGVISGALLLLSKPEQFDLSDGKQEMVVASTVVTAIVGAVAGGPANSRYGRRPVIVATSLIFCSGSLVMAFAPDFTVLVIGRLIVGLAIGASSMTIPIYISEVAPSDQRGFLVGCINACITGGQFCSSLIDGALCEVHNGWRFMLGIAALPAIVQFVGFLSLPESPRWLASKGNRDAAYTALVRIRPSEEDARNELRTIENALVEDAASSEGGLCQIWQDPATRKALILGCALQAAQQLAGINTVMVKKGYTPTLSYLFFFSLSLSLSLSASLSISFFTCLLTS